MFKLSEGLELELRPKITPKILKELKSLGLLQESDGAKILTQMMEIYTDDERFKKLVDCMFVVEGKTINYEEIDLSQIFLAYQDFFLKLVGK
jgi:predicted transcriptional regulator